MIFYFSGTGNSLYAAKHLIGEGERLIDIAKAKKAGRFSYSVSNGESVSFVFPVYFYTLSDIVMDFVKAIDLKGVEYVYAVITCGGGIGAAGSLFSKELAKKGIKLSRVFQLVMPDNSMLFYNIPPQEQANEFLKTRGTELDRIAKTIKSKENKAIPVKPYGGMMRALYHAMNSTKGFHATDKCISCGLCERNCPDDAIKMENEKPVWVKKKCLRCSSCICRCPVQAIEYGKATEKRNRYKNPYV